MRLSLRFLLPLVAAIAVFAYVAAPLADRLLVQWSVRDLDIRSKLIAGAIQEPLSGLVLTGATPRIESFLQRLTQDERLEAVAVCLDPTSRPIATHAFPPELSCHAVFGLTTEGRKIIRTAIGALHVAVVPIESGGARSARLALLHDMSFVERRSAETRNYLYLFFAALALIVALVTIVVAQLSWRGWVNGIRALLRGEGLLRPSVDLATSPQWGPIQRDVRALVRELETQFGRRDEAQLAWTPQTLRAILKGELGEPEVIVVSNREPYIHVHGETGIRVQRPASGLVTALEPIMRACSGTWIAHGSGSADRETADSTGHVDVPPGEAAYRLRRIWLTPEEESGYYAGFSNEGLWPLCHIAHVRPTFRSVDYDSYQTINQRFADAVRSEARSNSPLVLVQDYHFALLPRMIRELLPDATIVTFWHIPWPNPEAFAICPWREELVKGLLGSSILGFHTQVHCNNFLDTVDRVLEARVDRDAFTVTFRGEVTSVNRYPISIEWPPVALASQVSVGEARRNVRASLGLRAEVRLGVGVDRLDYTKGVLERFEAIDRLLTLFPEWRGRFTFAQVAAPTRGMIGEYRDYSRRVRESAAAINNRHRVDDTPAICLIERHHEPDEVYRMFRASDLCFVSSLHDGMNLVAKEFVAARDDERGVLILSQFAGAARELPEALIVNPYDADQCAAALAVALDMPEPEQRDRMRLMRGLVREFNVYRWAGRLLLDAAAMRRRRHVKEPRLRANDSRD